MYPLGELNPEYALEKGITQEEMGKLLGISKNNYNLKENGKLDFNLSEVKKF